ncbi:hypothetical protein D3C71_1606400 [compost metagenome]
MNKNYGLTNKPSAGVSDNAPEWLNDFFKNAAEDKKPVKKQHPFEGIDDPILNPQRIGVKK